MKGFHSMNRREALKALLIALTPSCVIVAKPAESTLIGTGSPGYSAKGLAYSRDRLCVADTENHVVRRIDLKTGIITTVLGTGQRGEGPGPDPPRCGLSRPHGVFIDAGGVL